MKGFWKKKQQSFTGLRDESMKPATKEPVYVLNNCQLFDQQLVSLSSFYKFSLSEEKVQGLSHSLRRIPYIARKYIHNLSVGVSFLDVVCLAGT